MELDVNEAIVSHLKFDFKYIGREKKINILNNWMKELDIGYENIAYIGDDINDIEISWHGVPEIIKCPEDIYRKSIAYYYVSDLIDNCDDTKIGNDGSGFRTKATFVKRPQDPYDETMEKLYKIRPYRRIEKNDLDEIYPEWNINM